MGQKRGEGTRARREKDAEREREREKAKNDEDEESARSERRGKSNTNRINELQEPQTALDSLAPSVEVLATKQETVAGDVKAIKEAGPAHPGKAGNRWARHVDKALAALAGAFIAWLLSGAVG